MKLFHAPMLTFNQTVPCAKIKKEMKEKLADQTEKLHLQ